MEGCLFRRNSDPTWSAARDDAHEQKEVPAGEAYKLSHAKGFATPAGERKPSHNKPKGGRRFVPCCPRGGGKNHLPFR